MCVGYEILESTCILWGKNLIKLRERERERERERAFSRESRLDNQIVTTHYAF